MRGACLVVLAGMSAAGCAHVEPPSGGPEDRTPPALLATRPDSLAVDPGRSEPITLVFDERISEQQVEASIVVSPRTGAVVVDRGRDEVRVGVRGGWRDGTIYHVTVLPGIRDLFGNAREEAIDFVFSTGPEIPDNVVAGRVTDAIEGTAAEGTLVIAVPAGDSLGYLAIADSAGEFRIRHLPRTDFVVRAFEDANRDRRIDGFEPRDSAAASLEADDSASVTLALLLPDSTPARPGSITVAGDSVVRAEFDDFLDPDQPLGPQNVRITGPGPARVISRVVVGTPPAEDTTAARPSRTLTIMLSRGTLLEAATEYRLEIDGLRNVVGLETVVDTTFTTPEEAGAAPPQPPLRDTTLTLNSARQWRIPVRFPDS